LLCPFLAALYVTKNPIIGMGVYFYASLLSSIFSNLFDTYGTIKYIVLALIQKNSSCQLQNQRKRPHGRLTAAPGRNKGLNTKVKTFMKNHGSPAKKILRRLEASLAFSVIDGPQKPPPSRQQRCPQEISSTLSSRHGHGYKEEIRIVIENWAALS
jgi:hypothetical protein